ncbi:hypothetical protein SLA2020_149800 [Shorea laevis]
MLNKAAAKGQFAYHHKFANVKLTHLCFVDDLIIFTEGKASFLATIDDTLKRFYSVAGLKVNCAKLELFCCGILASGALHFASVYGFKIGTLPVRYLGVPLIIGRLPGKRPKIIGI